MIEPTNLGITDYFCMCVFAVGHQSCPVFPPVASSMSECQLEPNILSFEVPYSEGVTAHRKGRDCLDCQRIWKGDKDLPVSVCLQLCFSTDLYNLTHTKLQWASPSVIIAFLLLFHFY